MHCAGDGVCPAANKCLVAPVTASPAVAPTAATSSPPTTASPTLLLSKSDSLLIMCAIPLKSPNLHGTFLTRHGASCARRAPGYGLYVHVAKYGESVTTA